MRIATWNLERTNPTKPTWYAIQDHLHAVEADVWILTEANAQFSFGDPYSAYHSIPIEDYHVDGECRTSIWTKLPVIQRVGTHDPETAVCIEVETPLGVCLVFGTVIPYADAGINKQYRSDGRWHTGQGKWAVHRDSILRHRVDLIRLRREYPSVPCVFAGDFNQHRFKGGLYKTHDVSDSLSSCFEECGVRCVTELDFRGLGQLTTRSSVDHVCLSPELVECKVEAWEAPLLNGKPISDHNGITVDIKT